MREAKASVGALLHFGAHVMGEEQAIADPKLDQLRYRLNAR